MDYSKTINLPETDFPMKANLPEREPKYIEKWNRDHIYTSILKSRDKANSFVLHDGPPYANGDIHMGHALNKILKDVIVKHKTMSGKFSPYVPGWDCHGLPIELKVVKELGPKAKQMQKVEIRRLCRTYAQKYIDIQKEQFRRLGVFADYENPYFTMSNEYEAEITRKFAELFTEGYIYKGKKPIYWCPSCETALAEAEVEYGNHSSTSVYVKFKIEPESLQVDGVDREQAYAVIWTTTPWTLPANLAIALHPDFQYSFFKYGSEFFLIADGIQELFEKETGLSASAKIPASKSAIETMNVRHPFIDRESKVIFGTHVTLEAGSGIVHTAPGHGAEDYFAGLAYGLDIYCPVDHRGRYTNEYPEMEGVLVWDANPRVVELLKEKNALVHSHEIDHSYPHCWRCRKPLIFRATEQWFMSVDNKDLRKKAVESTEKVRWIPKWGETRFRSMVEGRPDWCLSRQRIWGVPIPSFSCKKCGKNVTSKESLFFFADIAKNEGIDAWYTKDIAELIPPQTKCSCGSEEFSKEEDILDVWFDSGVSSFAVLEKHPDLRWPADMYLEGSDQHRGWFQSSLWPALALKGRPPYDIVLTHGFLLDEKGRAMSKSLGNGIEPEKIIKQYGADILRLWVTSEDYRNDLKIGYDMIKQIADSYRKIRNTLKFILGNLSDFSEELCVDYANLADADRWILYRLSQLNSQVLQAYENYEFHLVYRRILNFCAVDLSAIYFDSMKDALYTEARDSSIRRSVQTVLLHLLKTLHTLIAPILAFTAEEVQDFLGNEGSIHTAVYHVLPEEFANDAAHLRFDAVVDLKKDILKAIELKRAEGLLSKSQEADVTLVVKDAAIRDYCVKQLEEIRTFFQVAKVGFADSAGDDFVTLDASSVLVVKSGGKKCVRCWNLFESLGNDPKHPELCDRCTKVVNSLE